MFNCYIVKYCGRVLGLFPSKAAGDDDESYVVEGAYIPNLPF